MFLCQAVICYESFKWNKRNSTLWTHCNWICVFLTWRNQHDSIVNSVGESSFWTHLQHTKWFSFEWDGHNAKFWLKIVLLTVTHDIQLQFAWCEMCNYYCCKNDSFFALAVYTFELFSSQPYRNAPSDWRSMLMPGLFYYFFFFWV